MFIGHFGLGLAAKTAAPRVSLGTLFLSVQLADLLWPLLLLAGLEHVRIAPGITLLTHLDFYDYPISHSLVALVGWGLLFGLTYFLFRRSSLGALIIAAGVVSHWFLDLLMHRPDLPLLPGGPAFGLGLWNSLPATLAVEAGLYAVGIALYLRATTARDRTGVYAFGSLVAFLFLIWIASLFGPPPPSEKAVALAGAALWLVIPWGYWIDRHRSAAP